MTAKSLVPLFVVKIPSGGIMASFAVLSAGLKTFKMTVLLGCAVKVIEPWVPEAM
jgi:hypothetical protein